MPWKKIPNKFARSRKRSSRKTSGQLDSEQYQVWAGFCRIDPARHTRARKTIATDMHGICRFCLLATDAKDAVRRLTRACVYEFAFLEQTKSVIEHNLQTWVKLNTAAGMIYIWTAPASNAYLSAESYQLSIEVSDGPTYGPDVAAELATTKRPDESSQPSQPNITIIIDRNNSQSHSLYTTGFLQNLRAGVSDLLSELTAKGMRPGGGKGV
jgi:hypothetical protein